MRPLPALAAAALLLAVASGAAAQGPQREVRLLQVFPEPEPDPAPELATWAAAGLAVAGGGLALAWALGVRPRLAPLAALLHRLRERPLHAHPNRRRVMEAVRAQPGIHYRALQARTGLATGTLEHHLGILQQEGALVAEREGRLLRFRLAGAGPLPPALHDRQRAILGLLEAEGPQTQAAMAARLGLTRQGVNHHVRGLAERGLVQVMVRRGVHVCAVVPRAATPAAQA